MDKIIGHIFIEDFEKYLNGVDIPIIIHTPPRSRLAIEIHADPKNVYIKGLQAFIKGVENNERGKRI